MVRKIGKRGTRRPAIPKGRQTPGRGGGGAHGQKTRWLKDGIKPGWRTPWQVVVDPGTDNNSGERLGERYTWERDKYELWANEVAGVGACVITFDFKPVPKIGNDLRVTCNGYYTGNHASPQAPKFQVYDQVGTDWEDITGMLFSTGGSEYELLEGVIPYDTKYFGTGDNVRIRILHPVIGGNPTHEFHINEVKLGTMPVTTTTSTSTTSTTTTAP